MDGGAADGSRQPPHLGSHRCIHQIDSLLMTFIETSLAFLILSGVQVCVRSKDDRVEVWLGKTHDMREVADVGRKIKMQLGQGLSKMEFSIHNEEKEGFRGPCLMI